MRQSRREMKLSEAWIRRNRQNFRQFLNETKFPDPVRLGTRGPELAYPEWLIMFIAVMAVKGKCKPYKAIYRMTQQYWGVIAEGLGLKPISERQLRDRLKKICHFPGKPAAFISQLFPGLEQEPGGERGQDDDQSQGACVASEAEA